VDCLLLLPSLLLLFAVELVAAIVEDDAADDVVLVADLANWVTPRGRRLAGKSDTDDSIFVMVVALVPLPLASRRSRLEDNIIELVLN